MLYNCIFLNVGCISLAFHTCTKFAFYVTKIVVSNMFLKLIRFMYVFVLMYTFLQVNRIYLFHCLCSIKLMDERVIYLRARNDVDVLNKFVILSLCTLYINAFFMLSCITIFTLFIKSF